MEFDHENVVTSSPTVLDGTVFAGGVNGNVYAVDATDGTALWYIETGNVGVESSPAVVDNRVFIGASDNVYALDAETGEEQWRFKTGNIVLSSPTVADGTVFIGSHDGNVYALDAATGKKQWQFDTNGTVHATPTVVDDCVYVGSSGGLVDGERFVEGLVYALNARTGEKPGSLKPGSQSGRHQRWLIVPCSSAGTMRMCTHWTMRWVTSDGVLRPGEGYNRHQR